jgi:hypothetical protein
MFILLMGGIYDLYRRDGVGCRDIHTTFHKDWLRHSKVNGEGDTHTDIDRRYVIS